MAELKNIFFSVDCLLCLSQKQLITNCEIFVTTEQLFVGFPSYCLDYHVIMLTNSFSDLDRVAAAATIDERLNGGFISLDATQNNVVAERRIAAWCRSSFKGDMPRFETWLETRGLVADEVKCLLGPVQLDDETELPNWLQTWHLVLSAVKNNEYDDLLVPDKPIPFEDVLAPIVASTIKRLRDTQSTEVSLTARAMRSLGVNLLRRLSILATPTLYRLFDLQRHFSSESEGTYHSFIDYLKTEGFAETLDSYPVLGRLIANVIEQWLDTTQELIFRLNADSAAIASLVGAPTGILSISAIETGLSDSHNNGRMVSKLMIEGADAVYYKPRSVGLELAWSELCGYLRAEGATRIPEPLKVVSCQGYGWIREVSVDELTEIHPSAEYLNNFGSMLCLAYWMGATDLHAANFVHRQNGPVPIDLETIVHPSLGRLSENPSPIPEGVIGTMMLPQIFTGHGGQQIVLNGAIIRETKHTAHPTFKAINTDAMHRIRLKSSNREIALDQPLQLSDDEQTTICNGFEETYNFLLTRKNELLADRGLLSVFRGCQQRYVYRSTELYYRLLHHSLEPENLVDGVAWSLHFDTLRRFDDEGLAPELADAIHAAERQALTRLDIPYFSAESSSLWISEYDNILYKDAFAQPAFDTLHEQIRAMGLTDKAIQTNAIRDAYKLSG